MNMKSDHQIIASIINEGAHVLDLGCGNGELLAILMHQKKALVQGIELDENQMHQCVERGLTVLQGDIESGLVDYPDKSFDFVILNQIMQEIKKADFESAFKNPLKWSNPFISSGTFPEFHCHGYFMCTKALPPDIG